VSGWVAYRARQFFRALTASLADEELNEAQQALTPAQWVLFCRMSPADRRHGAAVYRALRARAVHSPDLLAAALLHDVGKASAAAPLWMRVAVALLERLAPDWLERLSRGTTRGWRQRLSAYLRHAELGAHQAAQAGCSPRTVALIRRHHEPVERPTGEEERQLALLQEVDGSW